MYVLGI